MASNRKPKENLDDLLSKPLTQGPIRRGSGYHLSTDEATITESPQSHNRTIAPTEQHMPTIKRVNRGYKLREDLIKQCKRVALEEDRMLYEVMEEALERYLAYRASSQSD